MVPRPPTPPPGPASDDDHDDPSTSIKPPKNLLSLPKELLTIVCSHLDQQSAIKLLYVHRDLHAAAEVRVYREAHLAPRKQSGRTPASTCVESDAEKERRRNQKKRSPAEQRSDALFVIESALCAFAKQPHRWSHLKYISVTPWWGSHIAIIQFLRFARPYVGKLELEMGEKPWEILDCGRQNSQIWGLFGQFGPSATPAFLSLTTLSLTLCTHDCLSDVALLLASTPHLVDLSIVYEGPVHNHDNGDCPPSEWDRHPFCHTLRRFTCSIPVDENGRDHPLVTHLLARAPLQELVYKNDMRDGDPNGHLVTLANDGRDLRHLEYNCNGSAPDDLHERFNITRLGSLTTLLFRQDLANEYTVRQRLEFMYFPAVVELPRLHTITWFTVPVNSSTLPAARLSSMDSIFARETRKPQPLHRTHVAALNRLPSLTTIMYGGPEGTKPAADPTTWEASGFTGTVIRTIGHNGRAIHHARSYVSSRSIHPVLCAELEDWCLSVSDLQESVYEHLDGTETQAIFELTETPEWQDATDFEGLIVPMWVIGDMWAVEEITEPWSGRDNEASAKAWSVLLDWVKATHPTHASVNGSHPPQAADHS